MTPSQTEKLNAIYRRIGERLVELMQQERESNQPERKVLKPRMQTGSKKDGFKT